MNRWELSDHNATASKRPRKKAEGGRVRPQCQEQGEGKLQARFDEGPVETRFGCGPPVYSTKRAQRAAIPHYHIDDVSSSGDLIWRRARQLPLAAPGEPWAPPVTSSMILHIDDGSSSGDLLRRRARQLPLAAPGEPWAPPIPSSMILHIDDGCMGGGGDEISTCTITNEWDNANLYHAHDRTLSSKRVGEFYHCMIIDEFPLRHRTDLPHIHVLLDSSIKIDDVFVLASKNKYHTLNDKEMGELLIKNIAALTYPDEDWDDDDMKNVVDIEPFIHNGRWALLVCGNADESGSKKDRLDFKEDVRDMYEILYNNGWTDHDRIMAIAKTTGDLDCYNYIDTDWTFDSDGIDTDGDDDTSQKKDDNNHEWVDEEYSLDDDGIRDAINDIDRQMKDHDIVYMYFRDHGAKTDADFGVSFVPEQNSATFDLFHDDELRRQLDQIQEAGDAPNSFIVVVMRMCFAGGIIDDCKGENRMILTSQDNSHSSYGRYNIDDWMNGKKGRTDDKVDWCDFDWEGRNGDQIGNNNGYISIEEAHIIGYNYVTQYYSPDNVAGWGIDFKEAYQTPWMDDQIPGEIYLWEARV